MAKDYLSLGCSPADVDCVQVGEDNYSFLARKECNRYLELIRSINGPEPEGARLSVKSFPHDFGSYLEVVVWFDDNLPASVEYAFKCEGNCPATWEDETSDDSQLRTEAGYGVN